MCVVCASIQTYIAFEKMHAYFLVYMQCYKLSIYHLVHFIRYTISCALYKSILYVSSFVNGFYLEITLLGKRLSHHDCFHFGKEVTG